jgi:ubiquinone/menaquinone biosynthesis C-methylase UbiE
MLQWLHEQKARPENLVGIDLLKHRIDAARRLYPSFTIFEANAEQLEFPDAWFDLVLVFTVFSSILNDATAMNIAKTISRVLKPDGAVVWYDLRYPNPRNRNVRAISKAQVRRLFPGFSADLKSLTLLPPLADQLGNGARVLYPILASIPAFRSHYLGLLMRL